MNKPLLHGENGLKPVSKAPKGIVTSHKMFIVGHSETGHHHIAKSDTEFNVIEVADKDNPTIKSIFLEIFEPTNIVHKKSFEIHETKVIQPGVYEVTHKMEYSPFEKVRRNIFD